MDMEGALRARLLADGAVTAIVGQRVYWEDRPQGAALPALVLHLIVDERDQHMGGFQEVRDLLLQVDALATSFASKKALKEAVIAALAPAHTGNGIRFQGATQVRVRPGNERTETQYIFRDVIEMSLHFSDA